MCILMRLRLAVAFASEAHKLYPVRMRVVNVDKQEDEWITIAYVPLVPTEKGPGGAERSRRRRISVLQRVLFLALRDIIGASHSGARFVDAAGRELQAFPRVLMYLCDQPEERAILCLKPGQCSRPCTNCNVLLASLSSPEALTARSRTILNTLNQQLDCMRHAERGTERQARLHMEKAISFNSHAPALAAMAGLTTAPFLLYKIIGFDVLHVRLSAVSSLLFLDSLSCGERLRTTLALLT